MTDRSTRVILEAKVDGYVAGMRQAKSATKDFSQGASQSFKSNKAEWDKLGRGMLIGGGLIAAGVGYAVKSFADFDQQMSAVGAALDGTPAQMAAVTKAVREAGKASVFTSVEAGQAAEELAKAGLKTKDIVGGALTGSMNLAAAGAIDLADAATITGQSMKIFNLRGSDATHIADVLTAGANKSAAGVDDLGQALRQGGLVASQTGLTLEETVGTLSAFADNALMGSDAGTSLKTMLQRLNPQSKQAADLMKKLGFSAYDAQGNFIGMDKLAGQLQTSFKGMSSQQRNAAMQILFGSDAVRGANVLYKLGEDGIRKYTDAVDDQGAAARTAAKRLDNLKGDFEKLTGALSDLFITAGGSGNDALRGLVQHVTDLVDAFGNLPEPLQEGVFYMGAGLSAALLLGGGLIKLVRFGQEARETLKTLGVTADLTGKSLGHLTSALIKGGLVVGVAALAAEVQKMIYAGDTASVSIDNLAESLTHLDSSAQGVTTGALADLFRDKTGIFRSDEQIVTTAEALDRFSVSAYNALGTNLDARLGRLQNNGAMDHFKGQVTQVDQALAQMVKSGNVDQAQKAFAEFTTAAVNQGIEFDKLPPYFQQYLQSLKDFYGPSQNAAEATGELVDAQKAQRAATQRASDANEKAAPTTKELAEQTKKAQEAAEKAGQAIDDLATAIEGLGGKNRTAMQANIDLEQAIDDVTEQVRKANKGVKGYSLGLDANTEAGRKNQGLLISLSDKTLEKVAADIRANKSQDGVNKTMDKGREAFVKAAIALDNSKSSDDAKRKRAEKLADQLGLNRQSVQHLIDKTKELDHTDANPKVTLHGVKQVQSRAGDAKSAIEGIHGKTVWVKVNYQSGKFVATAPNTSAIPGITSRGGKATGGPIIGAGTGTSDSIPAITNSGDLYAVSNGEWVSTARQVQAAGGFAGMARLMKAVEAGRVEYRAAGGPVGSTIRKGYDAYLDEHKLAAAQKLLDSVGSLAMMGAMFGGASSTAMGWRRQWAIVQSLGLGAHLSSAYRPGAVTASGYPSLHGMGRAIDLTGRDMMSIFLALVLRYPNSRELYYSPAGDLQRLYGRPHNTVGTPAYGDHFNHVHWAMQTGGWIPGIGTGDKTRILGEPGEFVVNRQAAAANAGALEAMNASSQPYMAARAVPYAGQSAASSTNARAIIEHLEIVAPDRSTAESLARATRLEFQDALLAAGVPL
ncbi:phage tail tape measure protein [Segeticoccus rhizosphaerae]|uniref:phage tail tape measure protein n=1 Tax=Segeticoccus rhizosphaerae TaxID=1104777 RepID=UPI0012658406|nr:phage tail tape measure protein [Segeticoccus rhizosphaerae]